MDNKSVFTVFGIVLVFSALVFAVDFTGPLTTGVTASPNPVVEGDSFLLTALVDDSTTGGLTISSAEYNVNGGAWSAMAASDGLFDEVSEPVEALLQGFDAAGDYTICARGTDSQGNVGSPECERVEVHSRAVNGGGHVYSTPKRKQWTFGSDIAMDLMGSDYGHFTLVKHVDGKLSCDFDEISNLSMTGNVATLDATGDCNDGSTRTVAVTMEDDGEPGYGVDRLMVVGDGILIDDGFGGLRIINGGNFQVADAASLYERVYTLFADGSISCTGADDLSDPDGFVVLSPTVGGVAFEYNFIGAEPNRAYNIAVSREPSCGSPMFTGPLTTDAMGDGSFSGFYALAPGTYNLLMNSVTSASGLSDPRHREISTVDARVIVP